MNKNIKAEFYRVVHSSMYFKLIIMLSLILLIIPFTISDNEGNSMDFSCSLIDGIRYFAALSPVIPTLGSAIFTLAAGNIYQHRMYFYEIMNGTNTHRILLSKITVFCIISFLSMIIPNILLYGILGIINGTGEMQGIAVHIIIPIICILHFTCNTVLVCMLVKNMVGSVILSYMATVITMFLTGFREYSSSKIINAINKAVEMSYISQLSFIGMSEYPSKFIVEVILSFIIDTILLYTAVYITYRKKMFPC